MLKLVVESNSSVSLFSSWRKTGFTISMVEWEPIILYAPLNSTHSLSDDNSKSYNPSSLPPLEQFRHYRYEFGEAFFKNLALKVAYKGAPVHTIAVSLFVSFVTLAILRHDPCP